MARLLITGATYTCDTQELVQGMVDTINDIPGVSNVQVNGLVITFDIDRTT